MKKHVIKFAVLSAVFVLSVIIISAVTNKGNTDITAEMSNAAYPVITTMVDGMEVNILHGYSEEMEAEFMRDTITPLQQDRKLTINVKDGSMDVKKISYEVRSLDTTRLVEDNQVQSFQQKDGEIQAEIPIKDLIDKDTEYILTILLDCKGNQQLRYYTRIILSEESHAKEQIDFANDLQNKIYNRDKTYSEDIVKYLESNSSGNNSSYQYVDIHSSYEQVTWGNLSVKQESTPIPQMKELSDSVATIYYDYMVSVAKQDGSKSYLNVEEYYYVRYTSSRMYLLDYERYADELFTPVSQRFEGKNLNLGITDKDIEYEENVDGTIVSFIQQNTLWQYNNNTDRIIKVFGFHNNDITNIQDNYDQHKIKVINMDETGNMQFMVCGYMNRGKHEGDTGIAIYYYDSVTNCIEEEAFLPSTRPYQIIKEDIGRLIYVNKSNELYIYLGDSIYKVDLSTHTYETVAAGLSDGTYTVSADNSMLAWQEDTDADQYHCQAVNVLSLEDGGAYQVEAAKGEYIAPLGFMEKDFIYGLAKASDVKYDVSGAIQFPMYSVCIRNERSTEIEYKRENVYILSTSLKNNVIQLERYSKNPDGTYQQIEGDSIMNNDFVESGNVKITQADNGDLETETRLTLAYDITESKPKLLTPREVVYEESRNVAIKEETREEENDYYYVYARYGMMGIYTDVAEAITTANEYSGVVLNHQQNYIWEKSKRHTRMKITQVSEVAADGDNSLSVCLTEMLKAAGYTVDAKPLLEQGELPLTILRRYVEGDVLDLSGLSVDQILYYVSRGYPVLSVLGENKGVLIVGYDEFNVLLMDPANGGTIYKKGLNDSREYFETYGNNFLSFVKE